MERGANNNHKIHKWRCLNLLPLTFCCDLVNSDKYLHIHPATVNEESYETFIVITWLLMQRGMQRCWNLFWWLHFFFWDQNESIFIHLNVLYLQNKHTKFLPLGMWKKDIMLVNIWFHQHKCHRLDISFDAGVIRRQCNIQMFLSLCKANPISAGFFNEMVGPI